MTNSSFICYKLIDDIIKRGGQEVSDHYIIKTCLNRAVLSTKKLLVNQMIKQTGIKSEYSTINNDLNAQQQPFRMKKDQYMCKSINKLSSKPRSKFKLQQRKCVSNSKIQQRKQTKTASTKADRRQAAVSRRSNKDQKIGLVEIQDIKIMEKINRNVHQQKIDDQMRVSLQEKHKREIENEEEELKRQELRTSKERKARQDFKKDLEAAGEHTYHTDGKFMVYSEKNKQKILNANFPHTLNSSIQNQKYIKKKQQHKPEQFHLTTQLLDNFSIQKGSRTAKTQANSSINLQAKQADYNNNQKRQISSIQFLKIKSGICFTQPNAGNSVRGVEDDKFQLMSFQQKKSSFSKFLTKDARSKTDGFLTFKHKGSIPRKNMIMSAKTEFHSPNTKASLLFTSKFRTSRAKQSNGKILDINEDLLQQLVSK